MRLARFLAIACLASPALAQEAGYQLLDFTNTTPGGSPIIPCRVYYPATAAGLNAPMIPAPIGGYPVVVYLHGFGWTASTYAETGEFLSEAGYVAVLVDTGQTSQIVQHDDAVAIHPLLVAANTTVGHPLEGMLDMSNVALSGHSMGANNTILILAANPGYTVGLALSPQTQGQTVNSSVTTPLGVIHGMGDTSVPWPNGQSTFTQATSITGSKFLYLFGVNGTHGNVALAGVGVTPEVWERSKRVQTGFYDCYLKGIPAGLEEVYGPTATSEPELSQLQLEVERPEMWSVGTPAVGQQMRYEVLGDQGPAILFGAPNQGVWPTMWGNLLLDINTLKKPKQGPVSATGLLTWTVTIPNVTVGTQFHFQGLAARNVGGFGLTTVETLTVQ